MKKMIMMVASMMFFAGNAMAQKLSASSVSIAAGGEASLVVGYESERDLTGAQFSITLPEGIELKEENYEYVSTLGEKQSGYNVNINDGTGCQIVIITRVSKKAPVLVSGEDLISLSLVAGANVAAGELKATISEIIFSDKGTAVAGNDAFEVAINVTNVTDPTGIRNIENAEQLGGTVYNLAGQKVSKAQKGVFIQNGRKVVIK